MLKDLDTINETISEDNNLFERVFDLIPVPVLVTQRKNGAFKHSFVNKKFVETMGYTLAEIPTPESWFVNAYPTMGYRDEVRNTWHEKTDQALLNNYEVESFRTQITTKTGEQKWFETKAALWTNQFNVITYIDIDDLKNQKRNLERLNRLKDRMIAVISHDFRSPLVSIKGLMNLLMDDKVSRDELKVLMPTVISQLNTAFNLLDDLLVWAKDQFENKQEEMLTFDAADMINECVELYKHAAQGKSIHVDVVPGSNGELFTHKELLKVAVRNILSNAIKFTHENGHILLSYYVQKQQFFVSVKDNGIGMSKHQLLSLFNTRSTSKLGTNNELGSGIGMILCQEAIEKINGKLLAKSELGKGSEFVIEIPTKLNPALQAIGV